MNEPTRPCRLLSDEVIAERLAKCYSILLVPPADPAIPHHHPPDRAVTPDGPAKDPCDGDQDR
jgi:hypothetical protein